MYIYLLIKIFFGVLRYKDDKWLKFTKFLFFSIEISVIMIYLLFLQANQIAFGIYLFLWCLFWILLFLFLKSLNYILKNFNKIIKWIEKKERIKKILLYPAINKCIYYFVWMLPWNMGYWIYFWVMENGWYFRVWICSNRDIIFYKYLKWDSRGFFFKLNKYLLENKFLLFIFKLKDLFFKGIIRILIFSSLFRRNILNFNLVEYVLNRIFIFCYLSMFYIFFSVELYIFNKFLIIFIIFLEILIIFFLDIIFLKLFKFKSILENFDIKVWTFMIDPLEGSLNLIAKSFFEVNNQVWNIILGDSISLNILKEYMLWVNKNTKGYYFYKMNILPKYNIEKLYNLSSIPFDILPRTRYVIMNLRYINLNLKKNQIMLKRSGIEMSDYRIKEMKNLYLTYFEKTYAVDSSLLSIIFLLRMNFPINYEQLYSVYVNLFLNSSGRIINYLLWNQKGALWRLRLAEINKANPELFNICYLLNSFKLNKQLYDVEYFFMLDFFQNSIEKKIPEIKEISSIKGYKENINLLTHFVLYEEEGIVWNNNVLDYLSQVEKNLKMKRNEYNEFFLSFSNLMHKLEIMMDIQLIGKSEKDNIEEIFEAFKFKFNKDLNLEKVLKLNLIEIKKLDLKIIEINFLQTKLILYCLELIKNLGELSIDDVKNSKYYFLFEEGN